MRGAEIRSYRIRDSESRNFDILVIGGGIIGASVARDAALRGLTVLLLEANDFAFGTSSRSSKLLHGGVRYLEQGHIRLVREALVEREALVRSAPHLSTATPFIFPIISGMTRPTWQVQIGLKLYDLLSTSLTVSRGCFIGRSGSKLPPDSADAIKLRELGLRYSTLLTYQDGQMDDARLTIEHVIDSATLGAILLNHARPLEVSRINSQLGYDGINWRVNWCCELSGTRHVSTARVIVNAGGPWMSEIQQLISPWSPKWPRPIYSRGSHLVFDKKWELPALILPTGESGRYYFVLPHFINERSTTLVGTTDRHCDANESTPYAREDEIAELIGYLQRDLPHSGLNENTLSQTFAGMRILVGDTSDQPGAKNKPTSQYGRSEQLLTGENFLSIIGGKYTTSRMIAERAVDLIIGRDPVLAQKAKGARSTTLKRPLPGGMNFTDASRADLEQKITQSIILNREEQDTNSDIPENSRNISSQKLSGQALSPFQLSPVQLAKAAIARLGSRASLLLDPKYSSLNIPAAIGFPILVSEILLAIRDEQGVTVDDILRRRFTVSFDPVQADSPLRTVYNELSTICKRILATEGFEESSDRVTTADQS